MSYGIERKLPKFSVSLATLVVSVFIPQIARTQTYIPVPVPVYDEYGAIAYSESTLWLGGAQYGSNQREAEEAALEVCRSAPDAPSDCRVVAWFKNTCASFARNSTGEIYEIAADRYRGYAERKALERCSAAGGKDCTIRTTVCSR